MTTTPSITIEQSWKENLQPILEKPYITDLRNKVRALYQDPTKQIHPQPKNLFGAFNNCPFTDVRVVILGQDPYHGNGQAHGLCFSVPEEKRTPPSLQNIFKEVQDDVGGNLPTHGNLTRWAQQGIFLLNAILTVENGKPASHRDIGWETFTDDVITLLSTNKEHLVFILWGSYAKQKQNLIDQQKHLILTAAHPSPYSATNGFFGCKHFSKTNAYLEQHNQPPIQW